MSNVFNFERFEDKLLTVSNTQFTLMIGAGNMHTWHEEDDSTHFLLLEKGDIDMLRVKNVPADAELSIRSKIESIGSTTGSEESQCLTFMKIPKKRIVTKSAYTSSPQEKFDPNDRKSLPYNRKYKKLSFAKCKKESVDVQDRIEVQDSVDVQDVIHTFKKKEDLEGKENWERLVDKKISKKKKKKIFSLEKLKKKWKKKKENNAKKMKKILNGVWKCCGMEAISYSLSKMIIDEIMFC